MFSNHDMVAFITVDPTLPQVYVKQKNIHKVLKWSVLFSWLQGIEIDNVMIIFPNVRAVEGAHVPMVENCPALSNLIVEQKGSGPFMWADFLNALASSIKCLDSMMWMNIYIDDTFCQQTLPLIKAQPISLLVLEDCHLKLGTDVLTWWKKISKYLGAVSLRDCQFSSPLFDIDMVSRVLLRYLLDSSARVFLLRWSSASLSAIQGLVLHPQFANLTDLYLDEMRLDGMVEHFILEGLRRDQFTTLKLILCDLSACFITGLSIALRHTKNLQKLGLKWSLREAEAPRIIEALWENKHLAYLSASHLYLCNNQLIACLLSGNISLRRLAFPEDMPLTPVVTALLEDNAKLLREDFLSPVLYQRELWQAVCNRRAMLGALLAKQNLSPVARALFLRAQTHLLGSELYQAARQVPRLVDYAGLYLTRIYQNNPEHPFFNKQGVWGDESILRHLPLAEFNKSFLRTQAALYWLNKTK